MVSAPKAVKKIMQVGSTLYVPLPEIWRAANKAEKGDEVIISIYTDKYVVRLVKNEKNSVDPA